MIGRLCSRAQNDPDVWSGRLQVSEAANIGIGYLAQLSHIIIEGRQLDVEGFYPGASSRTLMSKELSWRQPRGAQENQSDRRWY